MTIANPMSRANYWCALGSRKLGPFESREAAVNAARAEWAGVLKRYPLKRIMVGYGSEGPWFDISFEKLKDDA